MSQHLMTPLRLQRLVVAAIEARTSISTSAAPRIQLRALHQTATKRMPYEPRPDGGMEYTTAKHRQQMPVDSPGGGSQDAKYTAKDTDAYLQSKLIPEDEWSAALERNLERAKDAAMPDIAVSPLQGQFLTILAKGLGASKVLEIGTLGGYSTSWFARALPRHGQIDTLEVSPLHAKVANENFIDADLYPFPKIHLGPALDTLRDPSGPFARPPDNGVGEPGYDLVFIDANKDQIHDYFQESLRLTRKGGIILVDNAIRRGRITEPDPGATDVDVTGLRKLYDWAEQDKGKTVMMSGIQTVGAKFWDGFAIAIKL